MTISIEKSKDGYEVVRVEVNEKKQYIGSKYNHKDDIKKFIESLGEITMETIFIIFGLSLGEHIKELERLTEGKSKILVIELEKELISKFKENRKSSKSNIVIANNQDDVKGFFRENITNLNINNIKISYFCNYDRIYKGKLSSINKAINEEGERVLADRNTALYFGETWFKALLNNLKYICKSTPLNRLQNKYKNRPAIIVSAGPSLEKNIDLLKDKENVLILSGGRTLRPLMDRNITPSCIGVIDSGEVSYKLVEGYIEKTKSPLVYYEGTNEKVIKNHKGEKIFGVNNQFIRDIWNEEIISLQGGGSIAHSLTLMAVYLGCSPIIFIGQDLAYTGEKGHASIAENTWQKLTYNEFYKSNDDLFVKDINGDIVRTSIVLNGYRVALEEIIEGFPEIEFINATEGGADIKGTSIMTLSEVLDTINNEKIEKIETYLEDNSKEKETILELEKVKKNILSTIKLCKSGERILEDFKINYTLKLQKKYSDNLKKLDEIDDELRKNINELFIINSILFNTMYDIENDDRYKVLVGDSERNRFDKNLSKNKAIYEELEKVLQVCYKYVSNTIDEFILGDE